MTTTVYDIKLRYLLQDKATGGIKKMTRSSDRLAGSFDRSTRSSNRLGFSFGRLAALGSGYLGLRQAKSALVDFNSEMEQARTTTAGLLFMAEGGEFNERLKEANGLVAELNQRAKASTATTAEMVGFLSDTVLPLKEAGLHTNRLAKFTANAVVAAKAFGDEQTAAFDIQQALAQGVSIRDRFTRKLLGSIKMTRKEFNKLEKRARLRVLEKALSSPAIRELAKRQEQTFAGVTSTLIDNLQIAFGKAGLPLVKRISDEVKKWNEWIEKNPKKIEAFTTKLGNSLVTAFNVLRDIGAFLAQHKDLLLTMAKALLVVKATKTLAGPLLGGVGKLAGPGLARTLGKITIAAEVAYITGKFIEQKLEKAKVTEEAAGARQKVLQARIDAFREAQARGDRETSARFARSVILAAEREGILREGRIQRGGAIGGAGAARFRQEAGAGEKAFLALTGNIASTQLRLEMELAAANTKALTEALNSYNGSIAQQADLLNRFSAAQDIINRAVGRGIAESVVGAVEDRIRTKKPPKVNVTIQRIEVQSDDPDRFVFGMVSAFSDAVKNPSSALDTFREG